MHTLIGCLPQRPGHQVRLARSLSSDSPVHGRCRGRCARVVRR